MTQERGLVPYIQSAQDEGALSDASRRLLERPSVQRTMALAMGTPSSSVLGSKEVIVTILVDDSGSNNRKRDKRTEEIVGTTGNDPESNTQAVRDSQNTILDGLETSDNPKSILVSTQSLNGGVLDPYHPLSSALRLNGTNFEATGNTPLYRRTLEVLGGVMLKDQEAADGYKDDTRTITVIISDGGNSDGDNTKAEDVAQVALDLQQRGGGRHIIAAVGLDDGYTNFVEVFMGMGIKKENIMFAKDQKELLAKIRSFTKAAVQAANATQEQFLALTDGGGFGRSLTQQ